MNSQKQSLIDLLLGPPYLDTMATVLDEIEAERKLDIPREIELENNE